MLQKPKENLQNLERTYKHLQNLRESLQNKLEKLTKIRILTKTQREFTKTSGTLTKKL